MSRDHAPARSATATVVLGTEPEPTDEALFTRYTERGCEVSFETLYRRYEPRMRGFLLSRLGDPAVADDLTQNAFARVLRAAHRFDPARSSFSRWSHTIVQNLLKNHYRTLSRDRLQPMDAVPDAVGARRPKARLAPELDRADPAPRADPERRACDGEFAAALQRELDRLDPLYREPFVLYQVEQLSFAEVSERLGIPVGTAKSRTHRARMQLREALREYGPE